jgi:hypothetical protein
MAAKKTAAKKKKPWVKPWDKVTDDKQPNGGGDAPKKPTKKAVKAHTHTATGKKVLDALVAAELVERHEEDGDRRARIIVPTRRGLSIVERA